MTTDKQNSRQGFLRRLGLGAVPIALVCFLLWMLLESHSQPPVVIGVLVVCGLVLWFGWSSVRRTALTKWLGVALGLYVGLILALVALGIAVWTGLVLLVPLLIAIPFLGYDLFFRAPHQGRFASAREERPHLKS